MDANERRELAMIPAAEALVTAVANRDKDLIGRILASEIDYPALVVLLADMASRAPAATYVRAVIDDVRHGSDGEKVLASRYHLPVHAIRSLRRNNSRPADDGESPGVLTGTWVRDGMRQVYVPNEGEVA